MRLRFTAAGGLLAAIALAVLPSGAGAHPSAGELYVPWAEKFGSQRSVQAFSAEAAAAVAPPGARNMTLVGNADKDGTINSDLAFWGNLAYAGNYGGFRILDISGDTAAGDHRPRLQRPAERRLGLRDGRQAVPVPVDRLRPDGARTARARPRRSSTAVAPATRACACST